MIKYNYEVSVNENRAKLNKDIFLFRGNRNIHYYFSIKGARFAFEKEGDLIENANAIYAAVTVIKPNGVEVANAIAPVENGLIHLKVTEDLIDEEVEIGDFDLVFDLFDDSDGAVTIPKIKGQFHVQERPCTTSIGTLSGNVNVVNQAVVDLAIATQENEQLIVVDDDGKYVKTTWAKGDKISVERLNKMEEGIYNNSSRLKNIGTGGSTNASDITITDVNDNFESANVEGALNELGTQYKDIANNQPTDLSLDSATNLLQLVNSKGSKLGNGITLPTATGGGTSQYLHIKYSSIGAPQLAGQMSDTPNAYIGLSVDTNADSPTNPHSYTWYQWKGDNGAKGDTGATPNLQIGTVTTLDSGSSATATITGTAENPLLNLGIPKGNTGSAGTTYTLPKATASILGGIKVGSGLSVDTNGVLSATGGSGEAIGNHWELLKDITIKEEVEITSIDIPASKNITNIFVYVKAVDKANTTGTYNFTIHLNDSDTNIAFFGTSGNTSKWKEGYCKYTYLGSGLAESYQVEGAWDSARGNKSQPSVYASLQYAGSCMNSLENIHKIKINGTQGVGSRFIIYGK